MTLRGVLLCLLLSCGALAQENDDWGDDDWNGDDWGEDPWAEEEAGLEWTGFVEAGGGVRLSSFGPTDFTLGEGRARVETQYFWQAIDFSFKGDLGYDAVIDDEILQLRELAAAFGIGSNIDVKLGRQVLTWGTGDLLFLNDLFPKDFVSFFSGRDNEYLKAPGDAVKISFFNKLFNVDFVWNHDFDPDEYINGERLVFFSPEAGRVVSPASKLRADTPDDSEFALRLYKTVNAVEYAFYVYDGWFKQPNAVNNRGVPAFARLRTYGASVRRSLGPGLANMEVAWYDSMKDDDGGNPRIPNDQFRLLGGYEWEAVKNFNVGLQYYLEWTQDHDELISNSPAPRFEPDEFRHVLTNRLTLKRMRDKLTLSLFTFFSPSDGDAYLRPTVEYRYSDAWQYSAGANLFIGKDDHTFFGQLEDNSNLYARVRYYY
ncbi:MAG: hypothetical protein WD750_01430 [Gammaproteobacteria bacterium]